jgi:hypothetical protein
VLGEPLRDAGGVDQDVHMALVVPAPRPVRVADEGRHVAHEAVGRRERILGHEDPVVGAPYVGRSFPSGLRPAEIAQVDGQQPAAPESLGGRRESAVDGGLGGQVAEHVPDGDDGVNRRERASWKHQAAQIGVTVEMIPSQVQHRQRGVGGDDPEAGVHQIPGQQPTATSQFEDSPPAVSHRLEKRQDARSA